MKKVSLMGLYALDKIKIIRKNSRSAKYLLIQSVRHTYLKSHHYFVDVIVKELPIVIIRFHSTL